MPNGGFEEISQRRMKALCRNNFTSLPVQPELYVNFRYFEVNEMENTHLH
ncbi:hypothetical protein SAMN06265379_107146 [Saccharicrinis carchari]|uniref:Uncharacterized protein n=1 Tax=Saccharicrinis carchari TaxID=1168039 RepID=A0A521E4H9_SACCC|nr:hypothetical protein SAMN06265379_107146 [Saccharicrinis carchari]